ncbi:glycosyltransferase involved in cell wall biosynthesis [Terracoccus luteus]|uniref:Glycosyltransferase involved in cell wall biosynthesis n=1 Tax=Terracoccus luteus TaxID=53356 RepID=A0A495XZY9_9MICO|nr:glycosyltransferase family A protein [Terracoccus luteus]RKT77298.1 glycosyltransferase involved in cell wall biosynthesis [Terracoccus luteus]
MSPRVSVVVPTYNNAEVVEETVRSILASTLTDFELVVADHSSTDGTWERLQQFTADPRVRLLVTPPGGGAPANWARVTAEARGDYVKLVCGDDLIAPTCLEKQVAALDEHPTAVLCSSRRVLIDAHGERITGARGLGGLRGLVPGRVAARRAVVVGSNIFGEPASALVRRSALVAIGGWTGSEPFVIDQQTFCNLLVDGDFVALDEALASFRISASQWSVSLATLQSRQVVDFHHRLAADNPGLLSRADLVRGDTMARGMAYVRRAAYVWLAHRSHAGPGAGRQRLGSAA